MLSEYAAAAAANAMAEANGDLTAKQELQLMAVPQLGNVAKAFVRICENKEFKVSFLFWFVIYHGGFFSSRRERRLCFFLL